MRDKRYDIMKGISIITMIFCHLVKIRPIRIFVYAFHMPLFFINAGYFFKEKGIWGQIKGSFKSLIVPYIIIAGVHFIQLCFSSFLSSGSLWFSTAENYITSFVLGLGWQRTNADYSIGPIWFLVCLFWARIFFELILKFWKTVKGRVIGSIVVSAIGILLGQVVCLPYSIDVALSSMIFLMWGYYSSDAKEWMSLSKVRKWLCIFSAAGVSVFTIVYDYYSNTYTNMVGRSWPLFLLSSITAIFLYEVILSLVTLLLNKFTFETLSLIGKYSLYAFGIHYICGRFSITRIFFSQIVKAQVYLEQIVLFILTLVVINLILNYLQKKKNDLN